MGCCEIHNSNAYLSPISIHPSILLKEKRNSPSPKSVRFEISFTKYKNLQVEEDFSPVWYEPILDQSTSTWELHRKSEVFEFSYTIEGQKILSILKINFSFEIIPENLICLLNNPKYRATWDVSIRRLEILLGDKNLDALVGLLPRTDENIQLYERKVRKFKDVYCLYYLPHRQETLDYYFLVELKEKKILNIYLKEDIEEDFAQYLENKMNWTMRLIGELKAYQMF